MWHFDRLCGLVVKVPGCRSRGPDSIPGTTRLVVGLEQAPLSLVSTIEELLGRNISGSSLETPEYVCGDLLPWPHDILYPQKLALPSLISSGCLVCTVRLRTKATEFVYVTLQTFSPTVMPVKFIQYRLTRHAVFKGCIPNAGWDCTIAEKEKHIQNYTLVSCHFLCLCVQVN
jgi:hypothetical protein